MPSVWKYFCCLCDKKGDKRQIGARYKRTSRRQDRRLKSGKNTWTRRSLLDNEQIDETHAFPGEKNAYQMRAIPSSAQGYRHAGEEKFQERILEQFTPKKRPTVYNVFEKSADEKPASKTTFPWMDECFMPNARNGTRLGISSVQINAKRNETAIQKFNASQNTRTERPHVTTPYFKSISSTEGQGPKAGGNQTPKSKFSYTQISNKDIQDGQVLRSNISTAPTVVANGTRPVRLGLSSHTSERPIILKAPTSDVGVRRLSLNPTTALRQDRIPKLEDYRPPASSGCKVPVYERWDVDRPSVMDIFPDTELITNEKESDANLSYSSEIIFRKPDLEYTGSDVSLKRTAAPGIFSSKTNKYERLKPERSQSYASKQEKTKSKGKYSNLSESMYGYVPKAVQNVHVSNALEGNKIDDFFIQQMHKDQLENFASLKRDNDREDIPVIITTVADSIEDLTETEKRKADKVNETENKKKVTTVNAGAGTVDISSEKLSRGPEGVVGGMETPDDKSPMSTTENMAPSKCALSKESVQNHTSLTTDKNENKLIMIDFPPNLENDRKKMLNNLKSPSNSQIVDKLKDKSEKNEELLY